MTGGSIRRSDSQEEAAALPFSLYGFPFARQVFLFGLVCALALIGSSTLAGAASGTSSAGKLSARLTATNFTVAQAKSIKLSYKFSQPSTRFYYRLALKRGSTWKPVSSFNKRGSFSGRKTLSVKKLFGKKWIKVGYYRLALSNGSARKTLLFKVVPFSGRLSKKSFTIAQAKSVILIYAFSKPSKSFSYRLSYRKGSKWQAVRGAKKLKKARSAYFKGQKKARLKSLFGKKPVKLGSYRLKLTCAYSTRVLTFKVIKPSGPSGGSSAGGDASASGEGEGNASSAIASFSISGGVEGLEPDVAKPIRLTLTNPNSVRIFVTRLAVTISADSTPPGCSSATNLRLTQSNASSTNPIAVPARGSVTLTSAPRAPQITLLNLPNVNQNKCLNASFGLTFNGSAHS